MVQGIVSGSQLPVYSASLLNPTQNSVDFSLNSSIETPGAITAVLKPLNLSLTGQTVKTPFVTLNLPQTNLRGKSFITVTNQTTKILDMPSFMSFLGSAVSGANFSMQVTGKTDTFIGAIRAPISLDKTLQMVGMEFSHQIEKARSSKLFNRLQQHQRLQSCRPSTCLAPAGRWH